MTAANSRGAKAKIIGRWIALGPAAALVALITPAAVKYVNRLSLYAAGFDPDSVPGRAYIEALAGLAAGAVFVYVGARVAPDHRRNVAIALAAIGLFVTGASVLGDLIAGFYWLAWQGGCAAFGACAVAGGIVRGEILSAPASPPARRTQGLLDGEAPPPALVSSPTAPILPPPLENSWPKSDDKLKAAISLGSQMAEAEALWKLRARAQQMRPGVAKVRSERPVSRRAWQTMAGKWVGIASAWLAGIAILLGVSYWAELPKYRFEQTAPEIGAQMPGARLIGSVKFADLASPISWFWPPTTTFNFASPDPLLKGRFYLVSMIYEERNEPDVFLIDVDCEARKGEWYDQDEPDTAFPARTLWGEPVVTRNGKTYRRSKAQMALPEDWLHAFCDTDWTAERKAVGAVMFKTAPR